MKRNMRTEGKEGKLNSLTLQNFFALQSLLLTNSSSWKAQDGQIGTPNNNFTLPLLPCTVSHSMKHRELLTHFKDTRERKTNIC